MWTSCCLCLSAQFPAFWLNLHLHPHLTRIFLSCDSDPNIMEPVEQEIFELGTAGAGTEMPPPPIPARPQQKTAFCTSCEQYAGSHDKFLPGQKFTIHWPKKGKNKASWPIFVHCHCQLLHPLILNAGMMNHKLMKLGCELPWEVGKLFAQQNWNLHISSCVQNENVSAAAQLMQHTASFRWVLLFQFGHTIPAQTKVTGKRDIEEGNECGGCNAAWLAEGWSERVLVVQVHSFNTRLSRLCINLVGLVSLKNFIAWYFLGSSLRYEGTRETAMSTKGSNKVRLA